LHPTFTTPNVQRTFYGLATVLLVVAAMYWGRSVLLPLALATLFAFILSPAVTWLERYHLPRLPAVLVVVLLVFAVVGGLGYVLVVQTGQLADQLPQHTETIKAKINALRESEPGTISKLFGVFKEVAGSVQDVNQATEQAGIKAEVSAPPAPARPDVHWVSDFAGSAAEMLATTVLVVVLVIFMLVKREDLRDRLIRLFGHGHLTATTRALDEAAQRISRYLFLLFLVNAVFGTVLSIGLFLIGVPFALLWGFLAASLRFIPYVGIWVGAAFPILLSTATAPGWVQPLEVFGLILALELVINNGLEPILYGRSMGVSEVALLVSAAFWAWLWGPVGLILSVPMTVCLAVLGKYVSQLEFFAILLRDEPVLPLPTRYYQRLLAHDEDEAADAIEEYLRERPWDSVFDQVLLPALALARRDHERGELEPDEQSIVYQTTRAVLDDLLFRQQQVSTPASPPAGTEALERPAVVGVGLPSQDEADELALLMLAQLLEPAGCRLEVMSKSSLAAEMLQRVCEEQPAFVVVSALPPGGLARARPLCKRLRAQCPDVKVFVVRWGENENLERLREVLMPAGADGVATTLQGARAQLVPLVQVAAHGSAARPAPVVAASV
jgi:predicted PurR-regulated permease PerM